MLDNEEKVAQKATSEEDQGSESEETTAQEPVSEDDQGSEAEETTAREPASEEDQESEPESTTAQEPSSEENQESEAEETTARKPASQEDQLSDAEAFAAEQDEGLGWYVVHTYSGYEKKVKNSLDATIDHRNLRDTIKEVRIPLRDFVETKNGKQTVVKRNIFPGYILINTRMDDETWYIIKNTTGVTGFVGPEAKPKPLTEDELMKLGILEFPKKVVEYQIGEEIRIVEGPFKGFTGQIEAVNPSQKKAKVNISMFGRPTTTEFDFGQIFKLKE